MSILNYEAVSMDTDNQCVTVAGTKKRFSPTEYLLLRVLLENKNKIVPRMKLMDALYGLKTHICSNTLDVFLHKIRTKIGFSIIRTIWRKGVVLGKI